MPGLKEEIGKRSAFDLPEQEAYLNLVRTKNVLEADFAAMFKGRGLSEATFNALRILRGEMEGGAAGVPCQVIGERLITRVPDVTRLIDRLVEAGFAKRTRTARDRRVVLVSITKKGLSLLQSLDKPLMDVHKRLLRHLTREELADLNRLLVKARHPEGG